MLIRGVDFHSRFQQIAMVDRETGELIERRLDHSNGEAKKFCAELQKRVRGPRIGRSVFTFRLTTPMSL
jgi:hypothetical protein